MEGTSPRLRRRPGAAARSVAVAAVAAIALVAAAAGQPLGAVATTRSAPSAARSAPSAAPGAPSGAPVASRALRPAEAGPGGWETATPASVGMDPAVLDQARAYAFQPDMHTQGVVVVRGGRLVAEWYAPGEGPDSWAASWSVGKSFASALVGIAIAQGKIPNVDVPMSDYYPEWVGTPKGAMTLRDVLTMQSGLEFNEDYSPGNIEGSDIIQMGLSRNQLAYATSRPLSHVPGTRWSYSSGDAMLLSGVIQKATGMPADRYAQQVLFDPLGIRQVEWWRDGAGHTLTYCCLDTTSRNFARMGLLYLRGGDWGGTQVVPSQWVHDSFVPVPDSDGQYGYMWWMMTMPEVTGPIYQALGFDGQTIVIIPSLDLVVVRNGDYVKSSCPPVADPNLFGRYPPFNLVPGQGTRPPDFWWDAAEFLRPIVQSVIGPVGAEGVVPAAEPQPTSRAPSGQAMAPCEADAQPEAAVPAARPAAPVVAKLTYTG